MKPYEIKVVGEIVLLLCSNKFGQYSFYEMEVPLESSRNTFADNQDLDLDFLDNNLYDTLKLIFELPYKPLAWNILEVVSLKGTNIIDLVFLYSETEGFSGYKKDLILFYWRKVIGSGNKWNQVYEKFQI